MTKEEIDFISNLRIGPVMHSWRRISELYCDYFKKDAELRGIQFHGIELCEQAMLATYKVQSLDLLSDEIREKWGT